MIDGLSVHRLPDGPALNVSLVEGYAQSFYIVIGFKVSMQLTRSAHHSGSTADGSLDGHLIGILLASHFQTGVKGNGVEPEIRSYLVALRCMSRVNDSIASSMEGDTVDLGKGL